LNLKEIGAIIGVNESRVSQILKVTLGDLRSKLTNP
jgi:DNA-directed RNA polymerase specialized sigma subunit